MSKYLWYFRRLRLMGGAEVGYRIVQQVMNIWTWAMIRFGRQPWRTGRESYAFCKAGQARLGFVVWDDDVLGEMVERQTKAACLDDRIIGSTHWHVAPDTGAIWPRSFFAFIDYRPGNAYGDARAVWERSRLQELVAAAAACRHGDEDERTATARHVERELVSWVAANPPLFGVHYVSAMECGLRIVAACHALDLVRDRLSDESAAWQALVTLVESHAWFIMRRKSLFSSAGNHTIAEAVGLLYAGVLFPEASDAEKWQSCGVRLLAEELDRQVLTDGGPLEQSLWYLAFIVDLGTLASHLLKSTGAVVDDRMLHAVERAESFLSHFGSSREELLAIGDRDDGYALSRAMRPAWRRTLQRPAVMTFPASGYTMVEVSDNGGLCLVFDHGPLGMPPAFGHGHADALSIWLEEDGGPVFVDSGVFSYACAPELRRFFRGSSAHNTVTVDGASPAAHHGAFLWHQPYTAELLTVRQDGNGVLLLGRHDGYRRFGVLHWRGVVLTACGGLYVWDYLQGHRSHKVELNWHVAEGVLALDTQDGAPQGSGRRIRVEGAYRDGVFGPPCLLTQWRSSRYGRLERGSVVYAEGTGKLPCTIETVLDTTEAAVGSEEVASFRYFFSEFVQCRRG